MNLHLYISILEHLLNNHQDILIKDHCLRHHKLLKKLNIHPHKMKCKLKVDLNKTNQIQHRKSYHIHQEGLLIHRHILLIQSQLRLRKSLCMLRQLLMYLQYTTSLELVQYKENYIYQSLKGHRHHKPLQSFKVHPRILEYKEKV